MGTTHLKHAQANEFPFIGRWQSGRLRAAVNRKTNNPRWFESISPDHFKYEV